MCTVGNLVCWTGAILLCTYWGTCCNTTDCEIETGYCIGTKFLAWALSPWIGGTGACCPHLEVPLGSGTLWPYVHNLGSYNITSTLASLITYWLFGLPFQAWPFCWLPLWLFSLFRPCLASNSFMLFKHFSVSAAMILLIWATGHLQELSHSGTLLALGAGLHC